MNVVSFSGGKDSTAMLLMMLEKGMPIDRIVFIDTTKEFPGVYTHIEQVEKYIAPLKVEKIKINFDYWFGEHVKTRGKNKGKKGYGWANHLVRWCTSLKKEAFSKLICGVEYNPLSRSSEIMPSSVIEYHGIAYDERHRTDKNNDGRNIRYPLVEWEITEPEALRYCYSRGFNWGGLYEDFDRLSCFCCPLKKITELRAMYNKYPELWEQIGEMDKKAYNKFRKDCTFSDLTERFKKENS